MRVAVRQEPCLQQVAINACKLTQFVGTIPSPPQANAVSVTRRILLARLRGAQDEYMTPHIR